MTVLSDLSVFSPPLAWGFYNSLQRKSVASCKEPQVRNYTPLNPPPLFSCADQRWAACRPACFNMNAACFSKLPYNHFQALVPCFILPACPHLGNPALTWSHLALVLVVVFSHFVIFVFFPFQKFQFLLSFNSSFIFVWQQADGVFYSFILPPALLCTFPITKCTR